MKKMLAILSLVMGIFFLSACGSGSGSSTAVTTTTIAATTTTSLNGSTTTIAATTTTTTTGNTTTTTNSGYSYTISPESTALEVGDETNFSVIEHRPDSSTEQVYPTYSVRGGIGSITDQNAAAFRAEVVGTGFVVATGESGGRSYLVSCEITVNEITSARTASLYFDNLPLDFASLETEWFDGASAEAYMNNLFSGSFADTTHPFLSWFTYRSPVHAEGSMKWYLGAHHTYLPIYAVSDGLIVNAALSGSLAGAGDIVTIEGTEYIKDGSIKLIPDGAPSEFYVEYGHVWVKRSIFENSAVSTGETDGSGLSVSAGEVIAYMGLQTEGGYGLDFVVRDPNVKHPKLNTWHKYINYANPKLYYDGNNLSAINSFYDRQYQRVASYNKAPFMCVAGTGEVGHVNRNNNIWGIWYNQVSQYNSMQQGDYNMSLLILINKDDTNSETYTFPSSSYIGLYSEDATNGLTSDSSKYWWEPQVYDSNCQFTPVYYVSYGTQTTTSTEGILKIEAPDTQGTIVHTKYAKFLVSSEVSTGFRDDTLKIKYFDSLSAAQSGSLSGSILSDDDYYEYKKSYLPN